MISLVTVIVLRDNVITDSVPSAAYSIPSTYFFCKWKSVLPNLPHLFLSSHILPSSNHLFILCIYDPVSVYLRLFVCFLDSTYKRKHIASAFLLSDLFHLAQFPLGPSMFSPMTKFHSLDGWVGLHCTHTPHRPYPFIYWWAHRLHPYLGYRK